MLEADEFVQSAVHPQRRSLAKEINHEEQQLTAPDRGASERGRMLADLSNAIVRIHKQFYGKGPTKARAHLMHDVLVVVLDGGYTRGEQTLLERGHEQEIGRAHV